MHKDSSAAVQSERVRRLQAATTNLAHAYDPAQVAQIILDQALPALDAAAGVVAVLSLDGTELEVVASTGLTDEQHGHWRQFPSECHHPLSEAVRQGAPVWVASTDDFAGRYGAFPPACEDFQAWAALPLRIDGGGLGVLGLAFGAPQSFGTEVREWLDALAAQCAQALSRARLYEATTRAADRLARLQSLTGLLSQAVTAAQVAEVVVNPVAAGLGLAASALMGMTPDGRALALLASRGLTPALAELTRVVPLDAPFPVSEAVRSGAALWLPSNEAVAARYPELAARRAAAGYEALAAIPLIVRGTPLGALVFTDQSIRPWQAEDRAYILALAHQTAQALDRARLYEGLEDRVRERTAELEREVVERRRIEAQLRDFSAYLNTSLEDERTRISRQVHDELGGALTAIKMALKRLNGELPEGSAGGEQLHWLMGYTDELVGVVRRIAGDLRPSVLDDLGLVAALEWQLQLFEKQSGLACRLNVQAGTADIPPEVGTTVFRIVKESLTNILRHAEARAVVLTVIETGGMLKVTVQDDGRGLAPERLTNSRSLGLMGMHERARLVGGALDIESGPDAGTAVHITVPLVSE